MAEKITIAELGINTEAFLESASKAKKEIDELVAANKKLDRSTEEGRKQWVANDAQLKKTRAEYTQQKNVVNALLSPYKRLSQQLNKARAEAKDLAVQYGVNSKQARAAAVSVNKLDAELKKIDNSVGQNQRSVGKYSNALKGISASFLGWTAVIYGAIRALKDMFSRVVKFDKEMTGLAAILNVTKDEVKDLEVAIIDVAGSSIKTSNEVAALATTLITLGKTKAEVIDLLEPVNNLSIALGATSDEAGELLVQTLNAFGKGSESAKEYADIIAKMRTSTALDFERIKNSLGYLAPTAKAVGLSFENTGAIIGTLVDNGIKAERAGRLMSTSFIKLGAAGITLEDALEQINNSEDKLTTASRLLGVQSASLGLILADNTGKTADLTKEFENANGALKDLTEKQLESLDAQLKILDSTWEKFILNVENGNGALSNFAKSVITTTSSLISSVDDLNTVSEGFFDFFSNLYSLTQVNGASVLRIEAEIIKEGERRQVAAEQLADLLEIENKKLGINIEKEALVNELKKLNTDQINEQIKSIELKNKAEQDALKAEEESEANKNKKNQEQRAKDAAQKETDKKNELKNIEDFEARKKELQNSIDLKNAEDEQAKEELRIQQEFEKQTAELEALKLTEQQKTELLTLMETERQQLLNDIVAEAQIAAYEQTLESNERFIEANTQLTESDKNTAQIRANIASTLTGVLNGLLGDSLGAKLASIAIEAGIQAGLVKIEGAATAGKITAGVLAANASAIAASPLTGGLPFTAINTAQGISLQATNAASTASAITGILTGAALKGVGTLATSAFYEGGQIDSGINIPLSMRNSGGDDVLIQAKKGEVILNEEQQRRAGGNSFFKSLGVPSFNTGGVIGNSVTTQVNNTGKQNTAEFAEVLANSINQIKVVAIVDEITGQQNLKADIVQGANI